MTDFLTRISRAALGLTPVAQVLGISRYADRPQGLALDAEQDVEASPSRGPALPPPAAARALPARRAVPPPRVAHARSAAEPPAIGEVPLPATALPSTPALPLSAIEPPTITESASIAEDAAPFAEAPRSEPDGTIETVQTVVEPVEGDVAPVRKPAREIAAVGTVAPRAAIVRAIREPAREVAAAAGESASAEVLEDTRSPEAAVSQEVAGEAAPRTDATHASHRARPLRASPPPLAQIAEVIDAVGRTIRPRDVAPHAPAASAPPSPVEEQAGESAAPIIRVTIGRIDVRAAEPPAPPPEPPAPRLSLADYLRMPDGRTR